MLSRRASPLALVLAAGFAVIAASAAAPTVPAARTFDATGREQSYTVPAGVALIETDLQGGTGSSRSSARPLGAYLPVTAGEKLYVEVGSNGYVRGRADLRGRRRGRRLRRVSRREPGLALRRRLRRLGRRRERHPHLLGVRGEVPRAGARSPPG